MSPVVTSIYAPTGGVLIQWQAPYANSDVITAYKIEILDVSGTTWSESLTYCDGSSLTVFNSLSCIVPMNVLRTGVFGL